MLAGGAALLSVSHAVVPHRVCLSLPCRRLCGCDLYNLRTRVTWRFVNGEMKPNRKCKSVARQPARPPSYSHSALGPRSGVGTCSPACDVSLGTGWTSWRLCHVFSVTCLGVGVAGCCPSSLSTDGPAQGVPGATSRMPWPCSVAEHLLCACGACAEGSACWRCLWETWCRGA